MKNTKLLIAGVFLTVALPFAALLLSSQAQLGTLGRAPAEEGGPLFPSKVPGLAVQGRDVYVSLGCVACHTQQVRPSGQGSDIARGYGSRPSVARDYVLQPQVLLGERRLGPDLANYGVRAKDVAAVHSAIRHKGEFAFLYSGAKQEIATERAVALAAYLQSLRQDYSSPEAKLKQ
jgi:cytochrome c oxidase cbb3-type subunit 2